ncbi:phage baseplate protein [Streptomyces alkaliterrae]|uniref:Teichoic acid biosynthesis protein C n=1 Tax=Streptomyces alkaliterrae TaxID=2213162 RepID=A0A5P0YXH0_9ACTN|nr:teichoic acid biosynthesis protein C [Streptomyces alkaliterrae]MBB1254992.1 teichoic acid biosynthesis protein C [Streptomyces alkaliterrae]MBB1261299.1 teichoic acid biosynthesis protein C [Streptomyces alkaliterrae]MQS04983.1 teichoic acid biosynthesis protein C [Streptomyces alkaliterrae]
MTEESTGSQAGEGWSRRGALRLGGGAALAALGLAAGVSPASAAVPSGRRFDLTKPSYDLFRHKQLHDVTVQQSFSFDNVNRRLFVAQLRGGQDGKLGNLCITRLDFSGNRLGWMHLNGFGHGVSFAAQGVGGDTYLWTEVEANSNGYGRRLARFKWVNGATLSASSSALTKYTPVSGATEHTCAIDPINNRLLVRYHKDGAKHLALYSISSAQSGNFGSPLARVRQPSIPGTMQGYTVYGPYAYFMVGNAYSAGNPSPGNTYLSTVNLNTGKIVQGPTFTKAGSTLTFREPEGMAVYRTAAGEPRLFLGFASGSAGDRRSNLFYKNALV